MTLRPSPAISSWSAARATNRVLAAMLPRLPVHVTGESVTIDGVGQYPLATTAISLTYKNPYAPGCRVVWFHHETTDICPYRPLLYTSYSFSARADIIVHDRSGETPVVVAGANYGNDWALPTAPVEDEAYLPRSITSTNGPRTRGDPCLHAGTAC